MNRKTGHRGADLRRRVGADAARRSTRRKLLIALGAVAFAKPLATAAQQPRKVYRIGFLIPTSASAYASRIEGLRAGLSEFGYFEGKDYVVDYRYAEGNYDRLPGLAAELIGLKVDIIVTAGTPGTRAAMRASAGTPVVMAVSGDAVATGLIASLARPGGNVTGMTYFDPELHAKRLELLKEAMPRISRVGILMNPDNPQTKGTTLQALRAAAPLLKLEIPLFEARSPADFESALSAMAKTRVDAAAVADDPMFLGNLPAIAGIAANKRLPSTGAKEFADVGGMIGYGVNFAEAFRRAAYFVDKIVKGAQPRDLPVEQPTKFELVINLKTAKTLGIKIPHSILLRADKVIE